MKKYIAFHFSKNDDTLGYGDGRKIVLGETLSVPNEPELCTYGLHGSISIIDALDYASGSHLWVTEIWGDVKTSNNKICGKNRKVIKQYGDVLLLIPEFAKWCSDRAAKYATKYAAKYAAESAESAKYAAESAKYAAKYATEYAAESERKAQENWWKDKLSQL